MRGDGKFQDLTSAAGNYRVQECGFRINVVGRYCLFLYVKQYVSLLLEMRIPQKASHYMGAAKEHGMVLKSFAREEARLEISGL